MIATDKKQKFSVQSILGSAGQQPVRMVILLLFSFITAPAMAEFNEKIQISLGRSITTFDTDLAINTKDNSIDKNIDLEDDLNFDQQVQSSWFRASYRLSNRHRLRFTYTPIRRTAQAESQKDLNIEDYIIKAGATLDSKTRSEIYDVDYVYSFYKRPDLELGMSGGIYWYATNSEIVANGEIVLENNETQVLQTYKTKQKFYAPLPLLGMTASYELNSQWKIHSAARYLYVSIANITGRITSAAASADYYINDNWGIGFALSAFTLDATREGLVVDNGLRWSHSGAQFYIVYKK